MNNERRLKIPRSIRDYVKYNHKTGELIAIKERKFVKIGNILGTIKNGYLRFKYMGIVYLNHRVAFFLYHGYCPEVIDHINRDRSDNRICNLRHSNHSENAINSKTPSTNTSGIKGVHFDKINNKWIAKKTVDKQMIFLGAFENKCDAVKAIQA